MRWVQPLPVQEPVAHPPIRPTINSDFPSKENRPRAIPDFVRSVEPKAKRRILCFDPSRNCWFEIWEEVPVQKQRTSNQGRDVRYQNANFQMR